MLGASPRTAPAPDLLDEEPVWGYTGIEESVGCAVAVGDLDGDGWCEMALGLPGASAGPGAGSGRVEIYRGGVGVADQATWVRSGTLSAGAFGSSIRGADLDGDGFGDLLVGAPGAGPAALGRVYGFRGGPGGPGPVPTWIWSTGRPGDRFGHALDVRGSGLDALLVVGAPAHGDGAGAVLGFRPAESAIAVWTLAGDVAGGAFGAAVGLSGAGEGGWNHLNHLVVGAPDCPVGGALGAGRAYGFDVPVSRHSQPQRSPEQVWERSGDHAFAYLGYAVDAWREDSESGVAGAVFGDGGAAAWIAMGAPGHDGAWNDAGCVFVLRREPPSVPTLEAVFAGEGASASLGASVSWGDIDGDGSPELAAGAFGSDGEQENGGRVVVVSGFARNEPAVVWDARGGSPFASLGLDVSLAGNVTGDSGGDLVALAPYAMGTAPNQARVQLFARAPRPGLGTWEPFSEDRWGRPSALDRSPRPRAWPNPFDGRVVLWWPGGVRAPEELRVFDAAGRLHARLRPVGRTGARNAMVRWDGRDQRGEPVPAGLYFVQDGVRSLRLVRVSRR